MNKILRIYLQVWKIFWIFRDIFDWCSANNEMCQKYCAVFLIMLYKERNISAKSWQFTIRLWTTLFLSLSLSLFITLSAIRDPTTHVIFMLVIFYLCLTLLKISYVFHRVMVKVLVLSLLLFSPEFKTFFTYLVLLVLS